MGHSAAFEAACICVLWLDFVFAIMRVGEGGWVSFDVDDLDHVTMHTVRAWLGKFEAKDGQEERET